MRYGLPRVVWSQEVGEFDPSGLCDALDIGDRVRRRQKTNFPINFTTLSWVVGCRATTGLVSPAIDASSPGDASTSRGLTQEK